MRGEPDSFDKKIYHDALAGYDVPANAETGIGNDGDEEADG